ncbi:hypothetical protein PAXINDRAFT_167871 [Paxillus involutus ATCC 200175]|nr:hypothetical protein PAXINDRAFT_167871 [Paxillus involutus ATCC 200175]
MSMSTTDGTSGPQLASYIDPSRQADFLAVARFTEDGNNGHSQGRSTPSLHLLTVVPPRCSLRNLGESIGNHNSESDGRQRWGPTYASLGC